MRFLTSFEGSEAMDTELRAAGTTSVQRASARPHRRHHHERDVRRDRRPRREDGPAPRPGGQAYVGSMTDRRVAACQPHTDRAASRQTHVNLLPAHRITYFGKEPAR